MNRADYLVKPCPGWCVETHKLDRLMNDPKIHETETVTFTPQAAENLSAERAAGRVQVCIQALETLEDDGPHVDPTFVMLWGNDAELTPAEARQVAAILLDHADRLDQISAT